MTVSPTAITLSDLTYQTAKRLDEVRHGQATGGSTTTLIDTNGLQQGDDYWGGNQGNMGTVWVIYDAGGLGGAPEGQVSRVTDFVNSSQTATLSPALGTAIASGDLYAIAGPRYPYFDLVAAVNESIRILGDYGLENTTSLDTVANQTEYTLPFTTGDLKGVYYQGKTGDSDDNQWLPVTGWYVKFASIGTARTLVLPYLPTTRDVRLVYSGPHPRLDLFNDNLSDTFPEQIVVARAALILTEGEMKRQAISDPRLQQRAEMLRAELSEMESRFMPEKPRRRPQLLNIPNYANQHLYRDRVSPFPPYDN